MIRTQSLKGFKYFTWGHILISGSKCLAIISVTPNLFFILYLMLFFLVQQIIDLTYFKKKHGDINFVQGQRPQKFCARPKASSRKWVFMCNNLLWADDCIINQHYSLAAIAAWGLAMFFRNLKSNFHGEIHFLTDIARRF